MLDEGTKRLEEEEERREGNVCKNEGKMVRRREERGRVNTEKREERE